MKSLTSNIQNSAKQDYRSHVPGIICDIIECYQYTGMSAVLRVLPIGYSEPGVAVSNPKHFNVVCSGTVGVYGFPTAMKDMFYAYVLSDDPSSIEGKPAILIPKTFLLRNPGSDYVTNKDMIDEKYLKKMVMRKENLIVSRKLS
jgi:hypothetical protein